MYSIHTDFLEKVFVCSTMIFSSNNLLSVQLFIIQPAVYLSNHLSSHFIIHSSIHLFVFNQSFVQGTFVFVLKKWGMYGHLT